MNKQMAGNDVYLARQEQLCPVGHKILNAMIVVDTDDWLIGYALADYLSQSRLGWIWKCKDRENSVAVWKSKSDAGRSRVDARYAIGAMVEYDWNVFRVADGRDSESASIRVGGYQT